MEAPTPLLSHALLKCARDLEPELDKNAAHIAHFAGYGLRQTFRLVDALVTAVQSSSGAKSSLTEEDDSPSGAKDEEESEEEDSEVEPQLSEEEIAAVKKAMADPTVCWGVSSRVEDQLERISSFLVLNAAALDALEQPGEAVEAFVKAIGRLEAWSKILGEGRPRSICLIVLATTLFAHANIAREDDGPRVTLERLDKALEMLKGVAPEEDKPRVARVKSQIMASKFIIFFSEKRANDIAAQYLEIQSLVKDSIPLRATNHGEFQQIEEANITCLIMLLNMPSELKSAVFEHFGERKEDIEKALETIREIVQSEEKDEQDPKETHKRQTEEAKPDETGKRSKPSEKGEKKDSEPSAQPECKQQ